MVHLVSNYLVHIVLLCLRLSSEIEIALAKKNLDIQHRADSPVDNLGVARRLRK